MINTKSVVLMSAVGFAVLALGASQARASGNVSVSVNLGVMTVTGDAADNSVVIEGTLDTSVFLVTPGDGSTTINGASSPYTTPVANHEVYIDMGGGSDDLVMNNVTITRLCKITTGIGDSSVTMNNVVLNKQLRLTMGDGTNLIDMNNTDISEPSKIVTGNGPDSVLFDDVEYRGGITTKNGDDIVVLANSHHVDPKGKLAVKTGNGADQFTLTDANWRGKILVNTGNDVDTVTVGNITVGAYVKITGGPDADVLIDNGGHTGTPQFISFP